MNDIYRRQFALLIRVMPFIFVETVKRQLQLV